MNNIFKLRVFFTFMAVTALFADTNIYTWQDGDRQQTVHLNTNFIAEIQKASNQTSGKFSQILPVTDSRIMSALSKGSLPKDISNTHSEVFEEGQGGRKMTLPGDVFVEFNENWDLTKVKEWAATENLLLLGKLNSKRNMYRIQSNPGIESLHLANRLLTRSGVKYAFPNWWRESTTR